MKILVLLHALFFSPSAEHKFYFSETLLEKKPSNEVEITIKVFEDDWAMATKISNDTTTSVVDSIYFHYLNEKFHLLSEDKKNISYQYLGFEEEGEFIYIYLEFSYNNANPIYIQQSILFDVFEEQKNLVNYRSNGSTKSLYFLKDTPEQLLQWP
jgi:hypothetical protein